MAKYYGSFELWTLNYFPENVGIECNYVISGDDVELEDIRLIYEGPVDESDPEVFEFLNKVMNEDEQIIGDLQGEAWDQYMMNVHTRYLEDE